MPDEAVLRIEPGAANRIAQAFDQHAENLVRVARRLRRGANFTGFAGFPSAVELDAGFKNKALLAIANLESQADAARTYAVTLRAAGASYDDTDTAGAHALRAAAAAAAADTIGPSTGR